jgi:undecaprenyl-diphosphatase
MSIPQAVILGIVQGITEFFPISSSGHLVVLQSLFGLKEQQLAFDIFLHLGTLVSILIYFRKDIIGLFIKDRRVLVFLIIASVPTAIIGYVFKDVAERFFGMPRIVGYMLLLTGSWLVLASYYSKYIERLIPRKHIGASSSLLIGIAQGVAIMPGISRSGATIATGVLAGLDKELSFKFSLLLALPAVFGASLLKIRKIGLSLTATDALPFVLGGVVAMFVGLGAIKALSKAVRNNQLYIFGIYCFLVGISIIIFMR